MARIIFYRRVSTKEQGDSRLGLDAQLQELERFVTQGKHEVVGQYLDILSGRLGLDRRPGLREALRQADKVDAIVVVSVLDRLSRKASFIFNLMDTSTRFATVEDGLDCSPITLHIKAIVAEDERRRIGMRTRAAIAQLKLQGKIRGGVINNHALGVARSVATNKAEADSFAQHIRPVIERMRRDGMSINNIAIELNQQGNKTARGGQWHAATVANVMRRWS